MLTTIDRVISKLTLKHPTSDVQPVEFRDDATQFAAKLLENYKGQLSRRTIPDQASRSHSS